ncbi:methyltransferase [Marmoricola sp. RAF53]|uniref:methyltransferase n=1 Tax=Marmoricola sp. RAF53 TaxID=3233059 RepID=UPI003F9A8646
MPRLVSARENGTHTIRYGPLTIGYDASVLSPRKWTQLQAHWGSQLLGDLPAGPVLELCAGAGQIGLLTVHGHDRSLVAVDSSAAACNWARRNAHRHGIDADVRHGNMAHALDPEERFPLITADPPTVRHADVDSFPEQPGPAIDGGPDGLTEARRCVRVIGHHLSTTGDALIQLGSVDQVHQLGPSLRLAGLAPTELRVIPDRAVVVRLRHR